MTTTTYPASPMTSNSAPSPYVASANTELAAGYAAWKAFGREADPGDGDGNRWASAFGGAPSGPWFLKIDLGSAQTIHQYRLKMFSPLGGSDQAPRTWTFEGSNNNSTWTTLDTKSNETTWVNAERTYPIASPGSYRYYRLNITALNGGPIASLSEMWLDNIVIEAAPLTTGRGASVATCVHGATAATVSTGRGGSTASRTTSIASAPRSTGRGGSVAASTRSVVASAIATGRGVPIAVMRYGQNGVAITTGRGDSSTQSLPGAVLLVATTGRGFTRATGEGDHGDPQAAPKVTGRGASVAGMRKTIISAHGVALPILVAAFRADPVAASAGLSRGLWASTLSPRVYDDIEGYINGRHRGRLPFVEIQQASESYNRRAGDLGHHPTEWEVRIHVGGLNETVAEQRARNMLGAALSVLRGTRYAWLGDSQGGSFRKDALGYVLVVTLGLRNTYSPDNHDAVTE